MFRLPLFVWLLSSFSDTIIKYSNAISHSLLIFLRRFFWSKVNGSSGLKPLSNSVRFPLARTATRMAIAAVSPHMRYCCPESGSTKWKECIPEAARWSFPRVKKSRGTGKTALTSAGFGRGEKDSSMKPTTGVTSRPLCEQVRGHVRRSPQKADDALKKGGEESYWIYLGDDWEKSRNDLNLVGRKSYFLLCLPQRCVHLVLIPGVLLATWETHLTAGRPQLKAKSRAEVSSMMGLPAELTSLRVTSFERRVMTVCSCPSFTNRGTSTDALGTSGRQDEGFSQSNCFKMATVSSLVRMAAAPFVRTRKSGGQLRTARAFNRKNSRSPVRSVKQLKVHL